MTSQTQQSTAEPDLAALDKKLAELKRKAASHALSGLGNLLIGVLILVYSSEIAAALGFLPSWLVTASGYVSVGVGGLYLLMSVVSAVMLTVANSKLSELPRSAFEEAKPD